jgi:hypothetical protein
MDRGLRVPLSPREEAALRRVAQGNLRHRDLTREHRRRLKQLALILEIDGKLALTEIGRARAASMDHRQGVTLA